MANAGFQLPGNELLSMVVQEMGILLSTYDSINEKHAYDYDKSNNPKNFKSSILLRVLDKTLRVEGGKVVQKLYDYIGQKQN